MKYPRTYHLPFSPGLTNDDKKLQEGWFETYRNKEVVFTEKLDGSNTAMSCIDVYERSHTSPTRHPWSRNLWDPSDGLYWKIKNLIGPNETIYGENLYGVHSIQYDCLTSYWHMFAANDGNMWYSWDDVKDFAKILGVQSVPELERRIICDEDEIEEIINSLMESHSFYGDCGREGIVMRVVDSFPITDFSHFVCKFVRANHVQTDEHWTKTWKKASLYKV
ncbi:MAG: RNA ligase family protein [Bacteroidaceae bacterium]|nr:RNA ligase family protein [Bacteroidaceae bacterium]